MEGLAIEGQVAAVGQVDQLAVDVESGGAFDLIDFAEAVVEIDFFGYDVAREVGLELGEVALAARGFVEVFFIEFGAFGAVGITPFGLIFEEQFCVGFPIALEAGSFGSSGGGATILESGPGEVAENHGELAVGFGDGLFDVGIECGTV